MCQAAKDRKALARRQVQREAQECVNRYNEARHVAARATGLDYRNVSASGEDFRLIESNPLGRQLSSFQRGPYDGTHTAAGRPL